MSIKNAIVIFLGVVFGVLLTFSFRYYSYHSQTPTPTSNDAYGRMNLSNSHEERPSNLERPLKVLPEEKRPEVPTTRTDSTSSSNKSQDAKHSKDKISMESQPSNISIGAKLDEVKEPSNNAAVCKYDFKVFVYPLPTSLLAIRISEEARINRTLHVCQKCIFEQFSLEYIMYDFFSQFCGRTMNPTEADFFYLPIVRDAEYRMAMEQRWPKARAPSLTEQALLNILEKNDSNMWQSVFQYTDTYWHRYGGADHIIVMPAPVTNLRHESSQRGFFHYMSHLHRPIYLAVEYSIQFTKEYPICGTQKNIVVPYPTTDPDLFNGKLLQYSAKREFLLYYAGGLHGDCIETRRAMMLLMRNSTRLNKVIPNKVRAGQVEREHGFLASVFCPIPIGDSPSSKRMYDVLNFGCIPVVLSDDLVWAFSDQTGGSMQHSDFALQMPQSVVQYTAARTLRVHAEKKDAFGILPVSKLRLYDLLEKAHIAAAGNEYENGQYVNPLVQVLRLVPAEDIEHLRKHGQIAAQNYRFYAMNVSMDAIPTARHLLPDGAAMDMIANALSSRKRYGLERLGHDCQNERTGRKHAYRARYSCDTDKVDSLLGRQRQR